MEKEKRCINRSSLKSIIISIAGLQKSAIEKVSNTSNIVSPEKIQLFIDKENERFYLLSDTEKEK